MQTKFLGVALAAALLAAPAMAQDKPSDRLSFTANVTGVSDYRFRGASQTDKNPGVQGGIEAAFTINDYVTTYASLWSANVDFNNKTKAEFDYTLGLRGTVDAFGWDVKYIKYTYLRAPAALNYDFDEFAVAFNYDFGFVIPTVGVNYSPSNYGNTGKATYYYGGVKVPVPFTEFSPRVVANIGRQNIEDNAGFGAPDYTDWNVGLFATFFGSVDVGIQYVDTSVKNNRLFDSGVVGSIGYTLTF